VSSWRPAPDPEEDSPRKLTDSLDRVARVMGAPGASVLASVFVHWEDAVGPGVAAHADPVSLSRGTLLVAVDEPAWATELRYLGGDILQRLGALVGGPVADRLEVRVGPVSRPGKGSGPGPPGPRS
jgi:predicted nucleic acid-binding Zn ribbon protein